MNLKEVFFLKVKSVQNILNNCYVISKDNLTKEQIEILENINTKNYFTQSEIERGYIFLRNIPNKKVTEEVQEKILVDRAKGLSIRDLVKKYNFSMGTIAKIINNKY